MHRTRIYQNKISIVLTNVHIITTINIRLIYIFDIILLLNRRENFDATYKRVS